MYAVIRAGGKQYRVAPGDVIRVESQGNGTHGQVEFGDVLAVSSGEGQIGKPQSGARVVGEVVEHGRGDKILVFHYKRKNSTRNCAAIVRAIPRSASPRSLSTARSSLLRSFPRRKRSQRRLLRQSRACRRKQRLKQKLRPRPRKLPQRSRLPGNPRRKKPPRRKRNRGVDGRGRPSSNTDNWIHLWHTKKDKAHHATAATPTHSGSALRRLAGRLFPAAPSSCGSAAPA